eukprot:765560-Hanusia_phi.AAC.1
MPLVICHRAPGPPRTPRDHFTRLTRSHGVVRGHGPVSSSYCDRTRAGPGSPGGTGIIGPGPGPSSEGKPLIQIIESLMARLSDRRVSAQERLAGARPAAADSGDTNDKSEVY